MKCADNQSTDNLFRLTHGIIPALDNATLDGVLKTVEACAAIEGVVGFKIGLTTALQLGLSKAVSTIREITDLPIIYDHQKAGADIPDMGEKFCKIAAESGVNGLILFPLAGLSKTEQPHAKAGATFHAAAMKGKFHGVI